MEHIVSGMQSQNLLDTPLKAIPSYVFRRVRINVKNADLVSKETYLTKITNYIKANIVIIGLIFISISIVHSLLV